MAVHCVMGSIHYSWNIRDGHCPPLAKNLLYGQANFTKLNETLRSHYIPNFIQIAQGLHSSIQHEVAKPPVVFSSVLYCGVLKHAHSRRRGSDILEATWCGLSIWWSGLLRSLPHTHSHSFYENYSPKPLILGLECWYFCTKNADRCIRLLNSRVSAKRRNGQHSFEVRII